MKVSGFKTFNNVQAVKQNQPACCRSKNLNQDSFSFKGNNDNAAPEKTGNLLPGFENRQIKGIEEIAPENLVLVHMTDYLPENGVIKSTREATRDANGAGLYRDTVHFALNHGVYEHQLNSWNDKKVAVLAPLDGVMKSSPKENIVGGTIMDFFIKKSVKIPKGSVIVRHNPDVPQGKLNVINAEEIDEFKNTRGITVLETSDNVKDTANKAVKMMGYTRLDKMIHQMAGLSEKTAKLLEELKDPKASARIAEKNPERLALLEEIDSDKFLKTVEKTNVAFQNFVQKHGFKNYPLHSASPYGRSEGMIEGIKLLLLHDNSWEHKMDGGLLSQKGEEINYKKEFLEVIPEIKESLGEGETLTYDIDKLGEIIKESKTPKDALEQVETQLKLKPMKPIEEALASQGEIKPDDIYQVVDTFIGISPMQKMMISAQGF